jgi:hypothetical protein
MAATNEWATFGLSDSELTRKRRRWFKNAATSRMSWHDCHIAYTFLAIPFFFAFPWFLVGLIASLNGGYAAAFTVRPPGCYSRPLWWLAVFTSLLVFSIFTAGEIIVGKENGFTTEDFLVLFIITKLALGQLAFLRRIRRESPHPTELFNRRLSWIRV